MPPHNGMHQSRNSTFEHYVEAETPARTPPVF
jgi:hypothetical protein